jgi:large conductance mechanosensitive channel
MSFFKKFREFALRGNVVDLAVGVIIGASFGGIVNSLVNDVIMPPVGLLVGNVDFSNLHIVLKEGHSAHSPYPSVAAAKSAGAVTLNYGAFLNTVVNFLIIALAVFVFVSLMHKLWHREDNKPKPPPSPPRQEVLLEEIRDLLRQRTLPG